MSHKGKKRAATLELDGDVSLKKTRPSRMKAEPTFTIDPYTITIDDLFSGSLTFRDLQVIAKAYDIHPCPRSTDGLKVAIFEHLHSRQSPPQQEAGPSGYKPSPEKFECSPPLDESPKTVSSHVDQVLDRVADNLEDLSKLSVTNFSRHEDRISSLYARMALMEKLGGELSAKVEETARVAGTNRTMVDELAQQQEVLRANLELVQGEWAQAKEQLNAWHGEVTAAFDHMQVAQEQNQKQFQTMTDTLNDIAKTVNGIHMSTSAPDPNRASVAFLIDHDVCGLILHGDMLENVSRATGVFIQLSDRPEEFGRILHRCSEQDRNRLRQVLPQSVARVRRMTVFGTEHNIGLAFDALREWIGKVRNGERIVPL